MCLPIGINSSSSRFMTLYHCLSFLLFSLFECIQLLLLSQVIAVGSASEHAQTVDAEARKNQSFLIHSKYTISMSGCLCVVYS